MARGGHIGDAGGVEGGQADDAALPQLGDALRGAIIALGNFDGLHAGHRAVMLYLVQRMDCDRFAIAADVDPAYDAGLKVARGRGVEALCYACRLTTEEITYDCLFPLSTSSKMTT